VIAGVGLDLVEIERVASVLDRHGKEFLGRILHPDEDRGRAEPVHVAGLFAAKEAVMKALGTGMAGAAFAEIRIAHTDSGQPYVVLHGRARERAHELCVTAWQLSITHSRSTAAAVAIAVRGA
jgi:holo-[acyl-carrier protein] synthase